MTLNTANFCFSELPDSLLEHIFSYLSLNDVSNCARVCKIFYLQFFENYFCDFVGKTWSKYLADENNEIWRYHCLRKLSEKVTNSAARTFHINLSFVGSQVGSAFVGAKL